MYCKIFDIVIWSLSYSYQLVQADAVSYPLDVIFLFLDIPFYFSSNEWHLLLEILAILSMILGDLLAITQTSMKRMLAYSSIGQIGYVIIGTEKCCYAFFSL